MDFFTGLSVQGYVALQKNYALRPTDLYYPNLYLCGNCSELFVPTAYFEEENIQFQLLLNSMYTLQFIMRFSQYSTQVTSCVLAAMMFMSGECGRVCLGFFFFCLVEIIVIGDSCEPFFFFSCCCLSTYRPLTRSRFPLLQKAPGTQRLGNLRPSRGDVPIGYMCSLV